MMPSSTQVSLLREMGIPVWKLRGRAEVELSDPVDTTALLARISNSIFLVSHDSQITKQTNYLLQSMLSTIGLSSEVVCFISLAEVDVLTKLKKVETKQKVLLLMGEGAVKHVFGDASDVATYRNNIHSIEESKLTAIVSFGLDNLILNPQNKALAWKDLHSVKMYTNNICEKR
jgi:DNA polymerase III psi subunit